MLNSFTIESSSTTTIAKTGLTTPIMSQLTTNIVLSYTWNIHLHIHLKNSSTFLSTVSFLKVNKLVFSVY